MFPRASGEKWLHLNNHTSFGRLVKAIAVVSVVSNLYLTVGLAIAIAVVSVEGQWASPFDLYGKEDAPALHESPSYE